MSSDNVTRREALKMGGIVLAGTAGSAMLGGCAQASSAPSSSASASSAAGDRSSVPADKTGAQVSSASSIAEPADADIDIDDPGVAVKYDMVDCHLHYCDFLEKTDGFPALVCAQDLSGVSESVIFGLGIAKQWDEHVDKAPSYYLSNDCRCYYSAC